MKVHIVKQVPNLLFNSLEGDILGVFAEDAEIDALRLANGAPYRIYQTFEVKEKDPSA